jgi:hypothetical protein
MLYQVINILRKIDSNSAVNYVYLMCVSSKKFTVQSADFYRLPFDSKRIAEFNAQFIERFCEGVPSDRDGEFDSIEQAIAAHDIAFDN